MVATAGVAAADVTLSGTAEMGIAGGDRYARTTDGSAVVPGADAASFFSDIDVTFAMTGTTDNGLSFGASIDLDEAGNITGTEGSFDNDGFTIFISGGGHTLTMGDTDGALDFVMDEVNYAGGSIADDETAHAGFNGNAGLDGSQDGQVLRYDYAFGDFTFAASVEQSNQGDGTRYIAGVGVVDGEEDTWGVGVAYTVDLGTGTVDLGLGYQTGTIYFDGDAPATFGVAYTDARYSANDIIADANIWGLSANYAMDGLTVGFSYMDWDISSTNVLRAGWAGSGAATPFTSAQQYGLGAAYEWDAWTFAANYGHFETNGVGIEQSGYGLAVNYDLGGGAVIQFGYGNSDFNAAAGSADYSSYSLGLAMSF
ncbi:porin [Roseibacterium sp. SDUM158016]|nr:porin [Roseibacterium sp. SDUM158016]